MKIEGFRERLVLEKQKLVEDGFSGPAASAKAAHNLMQTMPEEAYRNQVSNPELWVEFFEREEKIVKSRAFNQYFSEEIRLSNK